MNSKFIIFKYEREFRNYIINNYKNINKIIIFEDSLDNVIYFYCFTLNNIVISCKENNIKNILYYEKVYLMLSNKYNLINEINHKDKSIKLIKKKTKE